MCLFQENNCLYNFKSVADSVRHMTLMHDKAGREAHPLGHQCHFIIEGVVCGQMFDTVHYLKKHKQKEGHFVPRVKKTS